MKGITVYNHGKLPTARLEDFKELQEDFKLYDLSKNIKLQMLIIRRGFKYAFKAWKDPEGQLWIIDAHQRKRALQELKKAGFYIPDIPYEPIHAESKKEAVEEIAAYNSEFGNKNPDTVLFQKYNIDNEDLQQFNLTEMNFNLELESELSNSDFTLDDFDDDDEVIPEHDYNVKPGDIFTYKNNRIMCGDSTNLEDVAKLMNKRFADLLLTDPPYNVSYEGSTKEALTIMNDNMSSSDFQLFLDKTFLNAYKIMRAGAGFYVFYADSEGDTFRQAVKNVKLKLAQTLIWIKNSFVMGRQDYQWQHEPILYGWKPTGNHNWYGDRKQSTLLEFKRPTRNDVHPTMKPIPLLVYIIRNSSKPHQIVVDLFGGSGSTLLAADKTDRIAYIMEKDPKYVNVILNRIDKPNEIIKL